jgi:hypothetical protein
MLNSAGGWGLLLGTLIGSRGNQELRPEDVDIKKLEDFLAEAKYAQHKKDHLWFEGDVFEKMDKLAKDEDKQDLFRVFFTMMSKNAITAHEMEVILDNLQ